MHEIGVASEDGQTPFGGVRRHEVLVERGVHLFARSERADCESHMSNVQARLLSSALALTAGAIAASTDNLHVNVGISIILISGAILVAEYVRSYATP